MEPHSKLASDFGLVVLEPARQAEKLDDFPSARDFICPIWHSRIAKFHVYSHLCSTVFAESFQADCLCCSLYSPASPSDRYCSLLQACYRPQNYLAFEQRPENKAKKLEVLWGLASYENGPPNCLKVLRHDPIIVGQEFEGFSSPQ